LRLGFKPPHTLLLTMPKNTTQKEYLSFISAHQSWIISQFHHHKSHILLRDKIFIFGEWREFCNDFVQNLWQDFIDTQSIYSKNKLKKFYQATLESYIQPTLLHWSSLMNLHPNKVSYGSSVNRLGCCHSGTKNIRFSQRLSLFPQRYIDSVIIHELAHLRFPNHQKDFWNLVHTYDDNPKQIKRWLKENHSFNLFLYHKIFKPSPKS
ncbi:MAG: M48 family metallopeptidase, partial [Helicobacter sp.]|nr:M48 family metallopeptidase [Helicobacter sp.]